MAESRLDKLKDLEAQLYAAMRMADDKSLASIAKQYRETLKEIEEIEGGSSGGDEIGDILEKRASDGRAGTVRKSRTAVPDNGRTGRRKSTKSGRSDP